MKRGLVTVAFALAWPGSIHAAEQHPWENFKIGTWVKWESTSVIRRTGAPDMEMTSETKQTLVERTPKKVVIEMEQSNESDTPSRNRFDIPFDTGPIDPKAPKPAKTGAEPLTIKGKTFPCTWTEYVTGDDPDSRSITRIWISEAMPGGMVKTTSKSAMGKGMSSDMTTVVSDYSAK